MKRLYSAERVNEFDRIEREKQALASIALIKGAAEAAYDEIKRIVKNRKTLILTGSGNNGADGLALHLILKEKGFSSKVYYIEEAKSEENKHFRALICQDDITESIRGFDLYIDAVYGASFHPPLKDDVRLLFDEIESAKAYTVSLDVPSAYYFKANLTISFTMYKQEAFLQNTSKRIVLKNPGFSDEHIDAYKEDSVLIEESDYSVLPFRDSDYKNRRGHLLIKAGSAEYRGAALLSAKAAFHSGAGLVTLETKDQGFAYYYPSVIVRESVRDYSLYSALLSGPGWAGESNRSFSSFPGPMVLDADALEKIEKGDDFGFRAVITPHEGEFRRLTERLGIECDAVSLSKEIKAIVVRKSNIVEIAYGTRRFYYIGNNPSIAVAGSGDVLAGIIGAFLASGMSPLDAAINAVILHQKSGRILKRKIGYYDSGELIMEVGKNR